MQRIYVGDTFRLDVAFTDDAGTPIDLTGADVSLTLRSGTVVHTFPATVDDPLTGVAFVQDTIAEAGIFSSWWRLEDAGGAVTTTPGDGLRVADPANEWATIADIEAIFGPQDDPDAVYAAIDLATALIFSWLCEPVPDPLPPQFRMATTLVAGRLLQAPAPGSPVAETIGDYSYRLATGPTGDALRAEIRQLLGPWMCGNVQSPRVWPAAGLAGGCAAGAWAWQLYLDCFDHVDGVTDGYQPDAEGLIRG